MAKNVKGKDSLPEKLKQFFRRKTETSAASPGMVRKKTVEYIITPDLLKEIGVEAALSHRLKTLRDLCEVVSVKLLEDTAVQALWMAMSDLLQPNMPVETRHCALNFLKYLIKGQSEKLEILRAHFFSVVKSQNSNEDVLPTFEVFQALTDNGKDILYFEEETGPFLLEWMPQVLKFGNVCEFMELLSNVLKYNSAYLDPEIISGLAQESCNLILSTPTPLDIEATLIMLDVVIAYSYLSPDSLHFIIRACCHLVNAEKFCQTSWKLMKNLLGTHFGHRGIYIMCNFMQDSSYINDTNLLRGAVFCVGMSLWGSQKVNSLMHKPASVLPSFLKVLSCDNLIVAYEVALSIQRLVKKYHKDLFGVTWALVFEIVDQLIKLVEDKKMSKESYLVNSVNDIISAIEDLYETRQLNFAPDSLFNQLQRFSHMRPEASVMRLIQYRAQFINPTNEVWIPTLIHLMERFYKNESNPTIRIKILDVLAYVLTIHKHLYEDDLIESVVLPNFTHLESDTQVKVRNVVVQLLVDVATDCRSQRCLDILDIIKKVSEKPFDLSHSNKGSSMSDIVNIVDASELLDVKTAVLGLINIFKVKLYLLPASHAHRAFELLVNHLQSHYQFQLPWEDMSAIRFAILELFLQLRASGSGHLGLPSKDNPETISYSSYNLCSQHDVNKKYNPFGPTIQLASSVLYPQTKPAAIPYYTAVNALISCLKHDHEWNILKHILQELPKILQNKTLLLSGQNYMNELCSQLCLMVSDRKLPENLRNTPVKFTRSEFHLHIFPVLAPLASYYAYISIDMQQSLIRCLQFGLVSRCNKVCINALTVCTVEMQGVMFKVMPDLIISLSKISATVVIAISMLEFLSTLIRLPKLYASFVEEQYMSVFAIALPYTNPFKFNHYIVSLAHHVIAMWFLKCRQPFRKSFVKFIIRGLRANVLLPFEEGSRIFSSPSEDSGPRERSSSMSDHIGRRKESRPLSADSTLTAELRQSMVLFHKELTETCVDLLGRYTFTACSIMPRRSPAAEFLLEGGQTSTWLVSNKLVTITTSGGSKILDNGLCEKCIEMCRANARGNERATTSQPEPSGHSASEVKRRHKSAIHRSVSDVQPLSPYSKDDIQVMHHTYEDVGGILKEKSNDELSSHSKAIPASSNWKEESRKPIDTDWVGGADFPSATPYFCNCWCQSWAEIKVRRPTGVTSWMMRIQNQQIVERPEDFPLEDLTSLFLGSPKKKYTSVGLGRIDSESLGDSEYDQIHQQYFDDEIEQQADMEPVVRKRLATIDGGQISPTKPFKPMVRSPEIENFQDQLINAATSYEDITVEVAQEACRKDEENVLSEPEMKTSPLHKSSSSPELTANPSESTVASPSLVQPLKVKSEAQDESKEIPVLKTRPPQALKRDKSIDNMDSSSKKDKTESEDSNIRKVRTSEERIQSPKKEKILEQIDVILRKYKLERDKSEEKLEKEVLKKDPVKTIRKSEEKTESKSPRQEHRGARDGETIPQSPSVRVKSRASTISVMTPTMSRKKEDASSGDGNDRFPLDKKEPARSGINPSFVFLQLYHSATIGNTGDRPILLPKTEAIDRAVRVLDRVPPCETHKIGIVYIDKGQAQDEAAILRNEFGSQRYMDFLHGLGMLIRLKDVDENLTYIGGLDTQNDGRFAYSWQDDIMQVIYHIATLMPTKESEPTGNNKKLHIGNDYVLIVYNDSEQKFKMGTIKGQFIQVTIVVTPLDYNSNAVTVLVKDDLKELMGPSEAKIVSDKNLPLLVRQLALHANLAARILEQHKRAPWDPYASNWLERLRQIKRIRLRALDSQILDDEETSLDPTTPQKHSMMEDFTDFV